MIKHNEVQHEVLELFPFAKNGGYRNCLIIDVSPLNATRHCGVSSLIHKSRSRFRLGQIFIHTSHSRHAANKEGHDSLVIIHANISIWFDAVRMQKLTRCCYNVSINQSLPPLKRLQYNSLILYQAIHKNVL